MGFITINHLVYIDKCIEREIKKLNNKHNILTLYSCCGHVKGKHGCIVVNDIAYMAMLDLGYKANGTIKNANSIYTTYETKSVCKCTDKSPKPFPAVFKDIPDEE